MDFCHIFFNLNSQILAPFGLIWVHLGKSTRPLYTEYDIVLQGSDLHKFKPQGIT